MLSNITELGDETKKNDHMRGGKLWLNLISLHVNGYLYQVFTQTFYPPYQAQFCKLSCI